MDDDFYEDDFEEPSLSISSEDLDNYVERIEADYWYYGDDE